MGLDSVIGLEGNAMHTWMDGFTDGCIDGFEKFSKQELEALNEPVIMGLGEMINSILIPNHLNVPATA